LATRTQRSRASANKPALLQINKGKFSTVWRASFSPWIVSSLGQKS
jgi:hypothetical protein